uniref:tRNA(Ile)-lysidine synthase n=1 Tax=Acrochaetium secundatum TaxID=209631 RepID=A0A4D6BL91_9FLOR|nr:tRNA(Ile)-lysidine synthetase [Acrochaetium secundatum]QBX88515.1 tRNA(Ile)-lysidine synthetase [Acrochaetium secundatum]
MDTFVHHKFNKNLVYHIKLPRYTSILIGLSGGQDSLCMTKLFMDIKKMYYLDIGIISIDHQWRYDTVRNIQQTINIAKDLNVKTYIYESIPKYYSEEEARNIRYQILINTAKQYEYSFIAVAHSLNDQIETGLHHIFRGSYIDSLPSLTWNRAAEHMVHIVRPMLNMHRWEINWFCRYFWLPIWNDFSNLECNKERNRIRQELIPYIQYHFSYAIENNIGTLINNTYIDSEYIRQNTIKLYFQFKHPYLIAINIINFNSQHQALQKRLLYLFFLHHSNINIPYTLLDQLIYKLNKKLVFKISYNQIIIYNNNKWLYLCYKQSIHYNQPSKLKL